MPVYFLGVKAPCKYLPSFSLHYVWAKVKEEEVRLAGFKVRYKVWHSPSFLKSICAGYAGTETKAHNPVQRWDQEPG